MLQKEFEQCLGKAVTAETFEKYNTLYMESELDKDAFVALYKQIPEAAVDDLVSGYRKKDSALTAYKAREEQLRLRDEKIAHDIMYEDCELQPFAERLTSKEFVMLLKLEYGFDLTDEDRTYLADLVKNRNK